MLRLCSLKNFLLKKNSVKREISKHSYLNNSITSVVSTLCNDGGLHGYRTNHSLRTSAATRLYQAGVDEQLITEVTGHRSNAVRNYKRTTTAQKRKISEVIQGSSDGNNNSPTAKCANSNIAPVITI
jgi:integrase